MLQAQVRALFSGTSHSLFHDLISAPSKSSVHVEKAVVVVSSRPSASRDLGRYLTHRIEVRGFTKEKRELYIREALKDDVQSAQILLEEIEDITNEELNLNLPLSVVILTHTFLSSGCKLPSGGGVGEGRGEEGSEDKGKGDFDGKRGEGGRRRGFLPGDFRLPRDSTMCSSAKEISESGPEPLCGGSGCTKNCNLSHWWLL